VSSSYSLIAGRSLQKAFVTLRRPDKGSLKDLNVRNLSALFTADSRFFADLRSLIADLFFCKFARPLIVG
jgi:hypothetical protein